MRNNMQKQLKLQPLLRTMALSALTIALAACQSTRLTQENIPVVQADIPKTFTAMPEQAQRPSIAAQGYQDFFADQRLKSLIAMALENNRDLRVAALNVDKVQQQYRIAHNGLLPTVGSSASAIRQGNNSDSTANYSVNLGVTSYELDFWGRVASLKDAALENYFATQNAKDNAQVALIAQIAQAWVSLSYAEQNLALSEQTLKTQSDAYRLNEKRFKAGIDSELPVRQAQVSVETARADVANLKTQIQQAKNALNLLVGTTVPNHLLPKSAVQKITSHQVLSAGLPSELLTYRPDLQQAEHSLRAAGANITAARARLYPTISLTGSAGLSSTALSDLFKSGAFTWRVGPSIDLPIFDWGTRKANITVSETDQKIALANYEKAIQVAFREVNDVLATRAYIHDRIAAQRRLVEATNAAYKISQLRFKAGIDNYLSVLSAQQNNYNVEKSLLALQQAEVNSQIELYKTLGGGATLPKQIAPDVDNSAIGNALTNVQEKLADIGQGNIGKKNAEQSLNDTVGSTQVAPVVKTTDGVAMTSAETVTFKNLGTIEYEAYAYTVVEFLKNQKLTVDQVIAFASNLPEAKNTNEMTLNEFTDRYVVVLVNQVKNPQDFTERDELIVVGNIDSDPHLHYRLVTLGQTQGLSKRKALRQIRDRLNVNRTDIQVNPLGNRYIAVVQIASEAKSE